MKDDVNSGAPAVELQRVCRTFGGRTVLDGIDLTIHRGEVFVLVGPSGSGKSTLLKIVAGIEPLDRGKVRICGGDCTATPPYRRPVHTVFQSYALFPHLDVAGNVAFPLSVAGVPRREREPRVREALGWVQLDRFAQRRIDTLSGGERQRVALARALVNRPQCVLFDEPLSALDPHLRAQTLELLKEVQTRLGMSYLYITHDREEALRLGDRVGVLNHGRLEQLGTPEEVYQRPATPFVASFLGKMNWLAAHVTRATAVRLATGDEVVVPGGQLARATLKPQAAGGFCPDFIGAPVRLGIRPEEVRVGSDDGIAAHVVSRQFSGSETALKVALVDGTELLAELRGDAPGLLPGTAVRVSWPLAAVHVFAGDHAPVTGGAR